MPLLKVRPAIVSLSLIIIATMAILLVTAGCDESPGTPEYNNVFDPENGSGNPLNLTAVITGSTIIVEWDQPQNQGITSYNIYHGISFSEMNLDTMVLATTDSTNSSFHNDADPTETHFFRISAQTNSSFSHYTDQTPAEVLSPPALSAGDGDKYLASRYTPITLAVSRGEIVIVADNPEFTNALRDTIVADGTPQSVPWDFGPAEDNSVEKNLYFKSFNDVYSSPIGVQTFDVSFSPIFKIVGEPTAVPTRQFDLEIPTEGVLQMRFADTDIGLADEAWLPAADIYPDYELADMAVPQIIHGEFRGDFGFDQQVTLTVTPELLTGASFYLAVPQDHVTDDSQILAINSANALQMRFSESMDFAATAWSAYQDTVVIQLSPEPGRKIIYAQFRNDWADSPLLTDYADYISQPGQVTFLTPEDGTVLEGGTGFNILGISSAESGTESVIGVELDLGDGAGYFGVTGTDYWSHLWDIPVHETDTEVVLRARAFTATDTVSSFVTVTVTGSGEGK